jgi:glycine cleavage system H protein
MGETLYTETHEWVRPEGEELLVGISDHAQHELGEIVYLEVKAVVGDKLVKGKEFAVLESVKAASDIYAPISGEVTRVNDALVQNTALINQDAEGAAWIVAVKPADKNELSSLLDTAAYKKAIGEG